MAGRGPLPNPDRRRRNAPTIPTSSLPASGRPGLPPKVPGWLTLGTAGKAWWRWAWSTPQAAGWSEGDMVTVGHRAQLEDDLTAKQRLDLSGVQLDQDVKDAIRDLAGLASGRLQILRECRELDGRLGLTPRGLADLRWKIVDDAPAPPAGRADDGVPSLDDRRRRLTGA